jgi:ketosteroid isomerase-like protein
LSEENVEIARRFNEEFNRSGWWALWSTADPDLEFWEPPEQPGASVFKGLEAAREGVTHSWDENWIEQRSDVERIVDLGDDRVLVLNVMHLQGREGVKVEHAAGNIVTFRDRKILRFQAYWSQQAALKAVGLEE